MANNALEKIISQNKKAFHDYFIDEKYECGIVLTGTEIKAIRNGKVNLQDSFCYIKHGEIFINGMNISKYEMGNLFNHRPDQTRKLLMHKIYLKNGLAKIEIALARGKKLYDKREDLKKKDHEMEMKKY